jgi:enterochelin esterase-like enzyme
MHQVCAYTVARQRGPRQRPGIVIKALGRHYVRVTAAVDTTGGSGRSSPRSSPRVGTSQVIFRLADPGRELAAVRLRQDGCVTGHRLDFRRDGQGWELVMARPPVTRIEYVLELRRADGRTEIATDPGNPQTVDGAFGRKSVLEFPGYAAPAWLGAPSKPGISRDAELPASSLGAAVAVRTWAPAETSDSKPLPLLVVHDGPEYDSLASLTRYLAAGVAGGWLPPLRAALLDPGHRDRWYSANQGYARALRHAVLPALTGMVATTTRIGMGTSLGALAMLHAHCRHPDAFDALFLQSGSFFTARLDSQERRFAHYRRIVNFVARVHAGGLPDRAVPVTLTCGTVEENLENNRLMTRTLQDRGYPAVLHEVPDGHNYTAWRDAFDPHLTGLLGGRSP